MTALGLRLQPNADPFRFRRDGARRDGNVLEANLCRRADHAGTGIGRAPAGPDEFTRLPSAS